MNQPGLSFLDYAAVIAYLFVTVMIVYWSSRKSKDTEDFFLGGRQMPWLAVGLSIMATLLSTNTYLGAPGEMIKYGPSYTIGYIAYPLLAVVVMVYWIPFFMRLKLTSAYEYLELRFDHRVRFVGDTLFLGLRLGWMSMVVYTASMAMVRMIPEPMGVVSQWLSAPAPIFPVIVAIGLVATIYAFFGGIRAVIWTDVLQAFMLFGGVIVIIGFVMLEHGTFVTTWWREIAAHSTQRAEVKLVSWDISERTTIVWAILSIFFWNVCTHCSDQVALQRYFTTASLQAARRSFLVNVISAASIGLLLAFAGLALRYHYLLRADTLPPGLTPESGADQIMPHFYATALPAGFGGLILVSFLCDAMQTLVSGVNSITAVIARNVSSGVQSPSDKSSMWRVRAITVGVGIGSTALAILAAYLVQSQGNTIFDMLPKMFNLFLGPLASLFMVGMFVRRARARTVLGTVTFTLAFSILWSWWAEVGYAFQFLKSLGLPDFSEAWFGIFGQDRVGDLLVPRRPTPLLAIACPCVVGILVGKLLSLRESLDEHPGTAYTWKEIMKKPPA